MKNMKLLKLFVLTSCFALMSCQNQTPSNPNNSIEEHLSWFKEEDLEKIHLSNLKAPIKCDGDANVDTSWFNDGYAFSQPCPNEEVMNENAEIYFDYFKEHYNGTFGLAKTYMFGETENFYNIVPNDSLSKYHGDNPSPLYKLYYVSDTTLDSDGFLKDDAVYSFEIRYEINTSISKYMLKIFIEKANKSHNGVFTYKYNLKNQ